MADIQAAEIHSYRQGNARFQPARDGLHRTLHCFAQNWEDGCRGWERQNHYTPASSGLSRCSKMTLGIGSQKTPALHRYWQTGYTVELGAYRRLQMHAGNTVQFREVSLQ